MEAQAYWCNSYPIQGEGGASVLTSSRPELSILASTPDNCSGHSQQEEKSAARLGSGSDEYALEEFYDQPFAPPEPAEPFYVTPSDSEEREEEGKVVS